MKKPPPSYDNPPALVVKGLLSKEDINTLAAEIGKHLGQLCLLVIHQSYSVRVRTVFRIMGPSQDSDYKTVIKHETSFLMWRALHPPISIPDGRLTIPTDRYIRADSGCAPCFLRPMFSIESIEKHDGPLVHPLLGNQPYRDPKGLPKPDKEQGTQSIEGILFQLTNNLLMRPREGKTRNYDLSLTFYIGNPQVYSYLLLPYLLEENHPDEFFLGWISAIKSLGCRIPKDYRVQAMRFLEDIRLHLYNRIVQELANNHQEEAKKLAEEYERKFGIKLKEIRLQL